MFPLPPSYLRELCNCQQLSQEHQTWVFMPSLIYTAHFSPGDECLKQLLHMVAGTIPPASGIPKQKCETGWGKDG
jgi:hypothetical protein